MYARPDIERFLDRYPSQCSGDSGGMEDIWDGTILREFCRNGVPFMQKPRREGRLVFGFNQDGLNPYGNKTGGKKVSVGPMYMVCFNLPPHLRYRMENIFLVGVIPGPREPALDQINHLLKPLVDDLVQGWEEGFYLSQTPAYPDGRLVRCALVPIIADLPAARRISGFPSFHARCWCSECKLALDDAENLQFDAWPKRTYDEHVRHARSWKQAGDSNTREKLFNRHQVRWSEFLRLPYWDPTRFITIDSMHRFYLGLFQHHIHKIWGMDVRLREGEEFSAWRKDGVPTPDELAEGHRAYLEGRLKGLRRAILIQLCRDLGLNYSGGSTALIDQLNKHVGQAHLCLSEHVLTSLIEGCVSRKYTAPSISGSACLRPRGRS